MCSNFQPIKRTRNEWVNKHFATDLPDAEWRDDAYPTYPAPFIYLQDGQPKCELAEFGLRPFWAKDKRFGTKTYNARSETVAERPSYKNAWITRQFGLAIMNSFYEPNWETGKAVRWRIERADTEPLAVASIWERWIDKTTGEIVFSFSMLTVNADGHPVMKHFHKPDDEKRSIVVLNDSDYISWLKANHETAKDLLKVAPAGFLTSAPAPLPNQRA